MRSSIPCAAPLRRAAAQRNQLHQRQGLQAHVSTAAGQLSLLAAHCSAQLRLAPAAHQPPSCVASSMCRLTDRSCPLEVASCGRGEVDTTALQASGGMRFKWAHFQRNCKPLHAQHQDPVLPCHTPRCPHFPQVRLPPHARCSSRMRASCHGLP